MKGTVKGTRDASENTNDEIVTSIRVRELDWRAFSAHCKLRGTHMGIEIGNMIRRFVDPAIYEMANKTEKA
jgi:hypothetical protein